MCGLAGAVGHNIDPYIVSTLLLLNEKRGADSTGVFTSSGEIVKDDKASSIWLRNLENRRFLAKACKENWAVVGHTRAGTRGSICKENAHPFKMGDVIGAHNGTVTSAPNTYAVDSMYLFDLLSKQDAGQYQKALGNIPGWYMLTYMDFRDNLLYFLNWTGTLHINFVDGQMYWSSEEGHLWTATGAKADIELRSGDVRVIDGTNLKLKELEPFTGGTFWSQQNAYGGVQTASNYAGCRSQSYDSSRTQETAKAGSARFDRTLDGRISYFGPKKGGGWFAHQRDGVWRPVRCQKFLTDKFPDAKPGHPYTLEAAKLIKIESALAKAKEKEHEDAFQPTEQELRESLQEQGYDQLEIDYEVEKLEKSGKKNTPAIVA